MAAVSIAVAIAVAYIIADIVARVADSVLRAIIEDGDTQGQFVDRPRRVVRLLVFLVTAAALTSPALKLAGYPTRFGGNPEALLRWFLDAGLRIVVIAICAYLVIRIGSAAARRFEREMSRGTGQNVIEPVRTSTTSPALTEVPCFLKAS